jgi:hypothetical protein
MGGSDPAYLRHGLVRVMTEGKANDEPLPRSRAVMTLPQQRMCYLRIR